MQPAKHFVVLAILLAAMPVPSSAQMEPAGKTMIPVAVVEERAPVPAFLGGSGGSLAFAPELEQSNYIKAGFSLGARYDDNALSTSTDQIGDFSYSILPHIEIDHLTSRLSLAAHYSAGLTVNQRLASRN